MLPAEVLALRPFVTTDADVVETNLVEIELGIKEKQFAHTAGFYKKVWWRGSDWTPNFATETGIVFPAEKDTSGLNFEGTGIFSWYLNNLTCHLTLGGGTEKEPFEHNRRGLFIYGIILDVPLPQYKKLHFVSEYSGEKMESATLDHQLLGGFMWEGPKEIEYDIAGFTGLNSESVDWGMTMGVTFVIGRNEEHGFGQPPDCGEGQSTGRCVLERRSSASSFTGI
jgi:hypothetical protein